MIGRGIRGPKNGGTKEWMAIDVIDNIEKFNILDSSKYLEMWSEE